MAWITNTNLNIPSSAFYEIPTGGARPNEDFDRPNTYINKLGAQRAGNPPVGWDDSPYKLAMSPNILNDPAFSNYNLSKIRTYEQDPKLRDAKTLRDKKSEIGQRYEQHGASGYTYLPGYTYDPSKVYIKDLDKLKMAVGPGAEQIKQGDINKEVTSTIAHEFRHTLFDDPKYQGIIEAAYNKFGGWVPKKELNEMITRAADVQLMPESWIGGTLDKWQDEYNQMLIEEGMPAHLTPMNTTKQFHQSAKEFFKRVKREKLKKQQLQNFKNIEAAEANKITTGGPPSITQKPKPKWTPPQQTGGDGGIHGGGGRPRPDKPGGFTDPGKGSYGPHKADGGLINYFKYGGYLG